MNFVPLVYYVRFRSINFILIVTFSSIKCLHVPGTDVFLYRNPHKVKDSFTSWDQHPLFMVKIMFSL